MFNGKAVIENTDFDQDRILIPSTEEGKAYHAFPNTTEGLRDAADTAVMPETIKKMFNE